MSRKGNCWDNAVAESFFSGLKLELVYQEKFKQRQEAQDRIFEYIEVFYNRRRSHSAIGYLSPAEYEENSRRQRRAMDLTQLPLYRGRSTFGFQCKKAWICASE
jgi:putative transposase